MGLSLRGQTSGAIDINAPNVAGDNTITLPGTNGAANQFYKNSGTAGIVTHSSMVEDSSGNIGIGTDNPVRKLHVSGSATQRIRLENTAASGNSVLELKLQSHTFDIGVNPTANYFSDTADQPYVWYHSSGERMRIDSSGKVGINQSSPTAFIHAKSGANDGTVIGTFEGATNNKLDIKFNSTGPALNVTAGDPLAFEIGGTERMRIDGSGRLGIGAPASTTGANLHIEPGSNTVYMTIKDTTSYSEFANSAGDLYIAADRANVGSKDMIFRVGGTTERMRIDSSGNVGIGRDSPGEKLDIVSTSGNCLIKMQAPVGSVSGFSAIGSNVLAFQTGFSERMRIDSNGQIQIGRTSAVGDEALALQNTTGKCAYVFQGANSNYNCMELRNAYATGGQTAQMIRFVQSNGAMVGQITSTVSATSYLSGASDRRLKKNIEDWNEDILQHFKTLNPSKFNYLTEEDGDPKTKGYIAQDLAAAFPEAYPNLYDEDADDNRYSYNPGGMVVYLMKALQEEIVKREALETQNASFEARLTALEG